MAGIAAMEYSVYAGLWVGANVFFWSLVFGKTGVIYGTGFALGTIYLTY